MRQTDPRQKVPRSSFMRVVEQSLHALEHLRALGKSRRPNAHWILLPATEVSKAGCQDLFAEKMCIAAVESCNWGQRARHRHQQGVYPCRLQRANAFHVGGARQ